MFVSANRARRTPPAVARAKDTAACEWRLFSNWMLLLTVATVIAVSGGCVYAPKTVPGFSSSYYRYSMQAEQNRMLLEASRNRAAIQQASASKDAATASGSASTSATTWTQRVMQPLKSLPKPSFSMPRVPTVKLPQPPAIPRMGPTAAAEKQPPS